MSFLGRILGSGAGAAIKGLGETAATVSEIFVTSDREKLTQYEAETARIVVEQEGAKGQIEINKVQAAHPSMFVAGARPAIMWICAAAMIYHFIFFPIFQGAFMHFGYELVDLEWQELSVVLMGMLGFGGMRSYEKWKGVARENMKAK